MWFPNQSCCPCVGSASYSGSWIWRCKTREHIVVWTCSWHSKYVGSRGKQGLKCIEPETSHVWKKLHGRLSNLKTTLKIYSTLHTRHCEFKTNFYNLLVIKSPNLSAMLRERLNYFFLFRKYDLIVVIWRGWSKRMQMKNVENSVKKSVRYVSFSKWIIHYFFSNSK